MNRVRAVRKFWNEKDDGELMIRYDFRPWNKLSVERRLLIASPFFVCRNTFVLYIIHPPQASRIRDDTIYSTHKGEPRF